MPLILTCIALDVGREVLFKMAAGAQGDGPMPFVSASLSWGAVGAMVWAAEILLWAQVLARMPLNVAFPLMSLTYAATPLAAWLIFKERISSARWAGIALVTAGAAIIGTIGQV